MDYESLKTPADDVVRDDASFEAYRLPGDLIDSQHPTIVAYARRVAGEGSDQERALRLYYAVRDELRYDPYNTPMKREAYRASTTLAAGHGYCVNNLGSASTRTGFQGQTVPPLTGLLVVNADWVPRNLSTKPVRISAIASKKFRFAVATDGVLSHAPGRCPVSRVASLVSRAAHTRPAGRILAHPSHVPRTAQRIHDRDFHRYPLAAMAP